MTGEIARMNVTRNYLHQSISEHDRVLVDLEHEQIRLLAKRDTVMAELAEKSYQLKEKREWNTNEQRKLDELKERVGK
jgi:hypothetical protein